MLKRTRLLVAAAALAAGLGISIFMLEGPSEPVAVEPTRLQSQVAAPEKPSATRAPHDVAWKMIRGEVRDPTAAAASDASVHAWIAHDAGGDLCADGSEDATVASTDRRGGFELQLADAELYCLQARHRNWRSSEPVMFVTSDFSGDPVQLTLRDPLRVAGRVLDPQRTALADFPLLFSQGDRTTRVKTDSEGRFMVANLDAGVYRVAAADRAYAIGSPREIRLETSSIDALDIRAHAVSWIRGRVLGPNGHPISGVHVNARSPAAAELQLGSAQTNEQGVFELASEHRSEELQAMQRMAAGEAIDARGEERKPSMPAPAPTICLDFDHPTFVVDRIALTPNASEDIGIVQAYAPTQVTHGSVRNHRGEPVAAQLTFRSVPSNAYAMSSCADLPDVRTARAGDDGRFRVQLASPARYEVAVTTLRYQPRQLVIDVEAGVELALQLD